MPLPNSNYWICLDFETIGKMQHPGGKLDAATIEPASLAAVAIDPATLEVAKWGGSFNSLMKPETPDWRAKADPGALFVNKLDLDKIEDAPPRKEVWLAFASWVQQFNPKKTASGTAPLPVGKNIRGFDLLICEDLSVRYGTADKKKGIQKLFHRRRGSMWGLMFDLDDILWNWLQGQSEVDGTAMDTIRPWVGFDTEGAHSAIVDVCQTAELVCRFLKLHRKMFSQIPFKNSCKGWKIPKELMVETVIKPDPERSVRERIQSLEDELGLAQEDRESAEERIAELEAKLQELKGEGCDRRDDRRGPEGDSPPRTQPRSGPAGKRGAALGSGPAPSGLC